MRRHVGIAGTAGAAAVIAAVGWPTGAQARLAPTCQAAHEPIQITHGTVAGFDYPTIRVAQVGNELRKAGHGGAVLAVPDVTPTEGPASATCSYAPVTLQQSFAAQTPNAWRIEGVRTVNGAVVRRVLAQDGEASGPNRTVTGAFTALAGERIDLVILPKCPSRSLAPLPAGGDAAKNVCYAAGVIVAGA